MECARDMGDGPVREGTGTEVWWRSTGLHTLLAAGAVLLLFLIVACCRPPGVAAATLTVTTTGDTTTTGDGLALREAISCINAGSNAPAADCPASPSPGYGTSDTIRFNISGTGVRTITLGSALPNLATGVVIDATTQPGFPSSSIVVDGGCTLNGSGQCTAGGARPFTVNSSVTATLTSLTIQHGNAGVSNGGALLNSGTLTLTNCTLSSNTSGTGGGIFNAASA
jgi:hypothetical protein